MKRLGIGMHSYGLHWKAGPFNDALSFLDYAHGLGAGGVQVSIGQRDATYARKLREKCEAWEMYLESQVSLPPDESAVTRFTAEVQTAQAAGATIMRTAMLGGRPVRVEAGAVRTTRLVRTYAEAREGELVALINSAGHLELATRSGAASERFGIRRGARLLVRLG